MRSDVRDLLEKIEGKAQKKAAAKRTGFASFYSETDVSVMAEISLKDLRRLFQKKPVKIRVPDAEGSDSVVTIMLRYKPK